MAKVKYRLYAMLTDASSVKAAASYRFNRITPKYILIYKRGNAPDGAVEIKNDDIKRLSAKDEAWLRDCNFCIITEESFKKIPETADRLTEMVNEFKTQLEAERQRLTEGGEDENE